MNTDYEDNPRNPELTQYHVKKSLNHFLIKYSDEKERVFLSDQIIKLIRKHELTDFHVEEKKAFLDTRIMYNHVTLVKGLDFNFEQLDKEFLKKYV